MDTTGTFNATYETVIGSFYNCSAKNDFLGAVCTPDGACNSFITAYQVSPTDPISLRFYSAQPTVGGAYLTSLPAGFPGIATWRKPDALCSLGYLWLSTQAGHCTVITPDGSGYYDILLEPQTPSAATALAYGFPFNSAPAPGVMGDENGTFWLVSNAVSANYLYVGNGIASLLDLQPSVIPEPTPIALPCFNPCSPIFPVFGKKN